MLNVVAGGTLSAATSFTVGSAPSALLRADLNSDGIDELIVANSGDNTVTVISRTAAGVPMSSVSYAVGANPVGLGVGDADGDGLRDVVVTNAAGNNIALLRGLGRGALTDAEFFTGGLKSRAGLDGGRDKQWSFVACRRKRGDTLAVLLGVYAWHGRNPHVCVLR